MGPNGNGVEDEITDALVGGSLYERLRVQRTDVFGGSIPRKLAAQSGLLVVLAFVLPITAAFPAQVRALFPAGDPTTASPQIMLLGVLGLALLVGSGAVLACLEYTRLRLEPGLTESQIRALLNWEEVTSLFGLGAGGAVVVLTDGFTLLGLGGIEVVRVYVQQAPRGAFTASGTGISVVAVATTALCSAVVLYTASRHLLVVGDLRSH
ncbi:hypothetical protein BRC86_07625 [Halobacteriales archaeon QS_3_64_16]|nr:MAG: hypothetical protein BRC86_07625 [Halobacteriales archaeon QS_3_64_16]